jgi:putative FmdB family regulatory protein
MPTYEYKCLDCERRFDVFQSMTADTLTTCEECGGKLKRLIGAGAGLLFKGSGFYATDYRSSSYQEGARKDKPDSSTSTKTETEGGAAKPPKTDSGTAKPPKAKAESGKNTPTTS